MHGKQDIVEYLTKATKNKAATYNNISEARRAVENTLAAIQAISTSKKFEKLTIVGLGTFKKVKRAARTGTNPKTGEPIKIKASKTLSFKVSKPLKDSLK
jgi:DNA-binding protein HU-beta